jgi:hypothetical protein
MLRLHKSGGSPITSQRFHFYVEQPNLRVPGYFHRLFAKQIAMGRTGKADVSD